MSAWKLVEAVPDVVAEAPVIQQSKEQGPRDNQSEQRPRNNRPRRNPQHHGRSKQERSYYAFLATQQMYDIRRIHVTANKFITQYNYILLCYVVIPFSTPIAFAWIPTSDHTWTRRVMSLLPSFAPIKMLLILDAPMRIL